LVDSERHKIARLQVIIDTSSAAGAYVGSDLQQNRITVTYPFLRWLYNRSLAQVIDSNTAMNRKGFTDLYDRLFVYIDQRVSAFDYAELDTTRFHVGTLDSSSLFKQTYLLNLLFIYTHELGHFVRHSVHTFQEQRDSMARRLAAASATNTAFQIVMDRMERCFSYYAFEQGLEVEADAFALGKMLSCSYVLDHHSFEQQVNLVFSTATSVLEAYKYVKSGFILDIPISTCNQLIRNRMMMYTRDSLLICRYYQDRAGSKAIALETASQLMEDSVRSVAGEILNLCENPQGWYEASLRDIEKDSLSPDASWEYYTAFMQNYLAENGMDTVRFQKVYTSVQRILYLSQQPNSQRISPFDAAFGRGLKEYLYLTVAVMAAYQLHNRKVAAEYYGYALSQGQLLPDDYYRHALAKNRSN
jgi:hypothetical protein